VTIPIHEAAARGFQRAADAYERGRPDYPPAAVTCLIERLGITLRSVVVEVGAGTGKLTRLLVPSAARIIAIEPVEGMRRKFKEILPRVETHAGTADDLPLPGASADAIVTAQAFHWFAHPATLEEFHRVLKPDGRLGLIWNVRDESRDWIKALTHIINRRESDAPRYSSGEWRRVFDTTKLFTHLNSARFEHVQAASPAMIVDRIASLSFVAALPEEKRETVLGEVRELLRTHPDTSGQAEIAFFYHTDVYWCSRK
jgi:SAM-dependent methyltransferase